MLPTQAHRQKLIRQNCSLNALAHDQGGHEAERERALCIMEKFKKELYENSFSDKD